MLLGNSPVQTKGIREPSLREIKKTNPNYGAWNYLSNWLEIVPKDTRPRPQGIYYRLSLSSKYLETNNDKPRELSIQLPRSTRVSQPYRPIGSIIPPSPDVIINSS
jgi:hypothetical protein